MNSSVGLVFHSVALVIQMVVFSICVYRYKIEIFGKESLLFIICWSGSFSIFEIFMILQYINKL